MGKFKLAGDRAVSYISKNFFMKQALFLLFTTTLFVACADQTEKAAGSEAVVKSAATTVTEAAPDSATMMKNWNDYMTPGKEHQMMASWDGTWNSEITMWMAPDAPPSKNSGTTVNKMVLGGRYQQSEHKSTWENMPMEGISTLAFDNAKKVFITTWIDNMGTGMMTGEGPWDEATKSITIKGKMIDPSLLKETSYREVFTVVDANTQKMEMYAPTPDGKDFKTMEIIFTRKK